MKLFKYKYICGHCEEEWSATYLKRYKKPRREKTCPDCMAKNEEAVIEDLGGLFVEGGCSDCVNFTPLSPDSSDGWGKCKLGRGSDNEEEYTLTWAIDNIVGCLVTPEEHESYEEDMLGLVYGSDYCIDFEPGSSDEV